MDTMIEKKCYTDKIFKSTGGNQDPIEKHFLSIKEAYANIISLHRDIYM